MSYSSGTFSLVAGNPVVTGTTITSTWANNTLSDIATGLSTALLKDGTQTVTANIPMSSFKLTGLAAGNATGNSLRYEQLFSTSAVALLGAMDWFKGADIPSAATVNLTTATGNAAHITGTVTITAVTLGSGMWRAVVFDGALTLTHHATNNNLPGGVNITTVAGDRALYWADGTTTYCMIYQPVTVTGTGSMVKATSPTLVSPTITTGALGSSTATTQTAADNSTKVATTAYVDRGSSGASWVLLSTGTASNSATIDFTQLSSTYDTYMVEIVAAVPATAAAGLGLRMSIDGGSTFKAGATDYLMAVTALQDSVSASGNSDSFATSGGGNTLILLYGTTGTSNTASNGGLNATIILRNVNSTTQRKSISIWGTHFSTAFTSFSGGGCSNLAALSSSAVNAIRFIEGSGNITSGTFYFYGLRKT